MNIGIKGTVHGDDDADDNGDDSDNEGSLTLPTPKGGSKPYVEYGGSGELARKAPCSPYIIPQTPF